MIRLDLERVAILGKLPTFPEYLRVGIADPLVAAFDAWLAHGMDRLMSRSSDPRWEESYANGAVHGFVYRKRGGPPGRLLVGAIAPSADVAGRTFPLVVAAPVDCGPEIVRMPELVPLLVEPFWVQVSQLLFDAPSLPRDVLEHRARALQPIIDADTTSTAASYRAWLAELPAPELWTLIHGPVMGENGEPIAPGHTVPLEGVLRMLGECIRPVRGAEQPATPLTLRLALGQAGGAAVCFWIDMLRRVAGWRETIPSFFWAHDGTSGALLLHLGEPPACTVSELWAPSEKHDEICDLTRPLPVAGAAWLPALPPRLAAACAPDAIPSVLALLELLADLR